MIMSDSRRIAFIAMLVGLAALIVIALALPR
jgi:hypothetical protein